MDRLTAVLKELEFEARVCKNLCALAEERGTTTLLESDIASIVEDPEMDPDSKLKRLKRAHAIIHEALYAPPSRG